MEVEYFERVIDDDAEAETDAIMFGIHAAPCLKIGQRILKEKEIFNGDELQGEKIKEFLLKE